MANDKDPKKVTTDKYDAVATDDNPYPWADCSSPYNCDHGGCDCWDRKPKDDPFAPKKDNSLFSVNIKFGI